MIVRALFLVVTAFLGVVLPCAEAWAQTIQLGTAITRRADRPSGVDQKSINYDDCIADDTLSIQANLTGSAAALEVWAGISASCADITFRTTTNNVPAQCWLVAVQTPAMTANIEMKVRDIIPHNASGQNTGTEAICDEKATGTTTGNGNVTLYFVLVASETTSGGMGAASPALTYDLQGPPPPTKLTALLGDTRLYPTWTLSTSAIDSKGYNLYCEESSSTSPCAGTMLVAGSPPPSEAEVRGSTGASATSGEAGGLTNGVAYACGVAGYDALDNVGKLSEHVCATPEPVNGYFKQYRAAGGTAGGGYCSFARRAATPAGMVTSLAALALLFVRRGRRKAAA